MPGRLYSATTVTGGTPVTTYYRYDAGGNLLAQRDGPVTTVYLPGEDLTADGTTVTATRYYTFGGQVIAVAVPDPAGGPKLVSWMFTDPRGTATTAINAATQDITRRYYTPYGIPLTTPAWPGTRGYAGGTTDPATGLTNLGAREYNPALPQFLSPDPILTPANPSDLNPYTYAYNNPVNGSDPTGLYLPSEGGGCPSSEPGCPGYNGGAAASGEPPAVRQAYNGYLDGAAGGYAIQPWMQWKALSQACASTGACGPGVSARAGYQYTLTWSQARRQQLAGPKPPLWEALAEIYGGTAAGAAFAELAGPGYDAAYTLSVQTSAWWLTLSTSATATALTSTENDTTEADAMAGVRAAGINGERLAGIIKNTDRIPSLTGTAAYRIPDELNSSIIGEVKNVSSLSYTSQLRDFAAYAQQEELTFNLYVRGSTVLSDPLQAEVNAGDINLLRILPG